MSQELRKRKKYLSRTFSKALFLTLFLHLCIFGLFKVKITPTASSIPLKPLNIMAKAHIQEFFAAHSETNPSPLQSFSTPQAPPILKPHKTPSWPQGSLSPIKVTPSPIHGMKHSNLWVFDQLEQLSYNAPKRPNLSYGSSYQPIKVELFGSLHHLSPRYIPHQKEVFYYPKHAKTLPYLFTFNVKVENKTGRVFWLAPSKEHQGTGLAKLQHLAQNVAKKVMFKKQKKDRGITEGTIEVLFEIEEGKTLPKNLVLR